MLICYVLLSFILACNLPAVSNGWFDGCCMEGQTIDQGTSCLLECDADYAGSVDVVTCAGNGVLSDGSPTCAGNAWLILGLLGCTPVAPHSRIFLCHFRMLCVAYIKIYCMCS